MFPPAAVSVSELTGYVRSILEGDDGLQDIWVRGEVSNFSRPASGHLYFTLKDQGASLRCVMWRSSAARQSFLPGDGAAILVHGAIGVYEAGGQYQLYADAIRPAGEGALYQEFMRLKARLEAQGLFATERKRPIPVRPSRIGIVTSATGAALRDMLKTIGRRYPLVEVVLAPCAVQGDEAPAGIVAALQALNNLDPRPDTILLARGGGSIEDLWAFNDERVANAIFASTSPVISGVGHETDFTIADFVADLRAPTPTAAAELATPDHAELRQALADRSARLQRASQAVILGLRRELSEVQHRFVSRSPATRLRSEKQYLDEFTARLVRSAGYRLGLQRSDLASLAARLLTLNPLHVLQRGYVMVSRPDGRFISHASEVAPGDLLQLQFQDGEQSVQVLDNGFSPLGDE